MRHLANQRSLNVSPMLMRKVFSVIRSLAEVRAHCALTFSTERLLQPFCRGMPRPALMLSSLGPS